MKRRKFLQKGGLAGAALLTGSVTSVAIRKRTIIAG